MNGDNFAIGNHLAFDEEENERSNEIPSRKKVLQQKIYWILRYLYTVQSEKCDVTETSTDIEESNSIVVTDSFLIENNFSHVPPHQDYEPQYQDNLNMPTSNVSGPEDFKYWEYFNPIYTGLWNNWFLPEGGDFTPSPQQIRFSRSLECTKIDATSHT